ncbi:MAG: hypothetical protein QM791_01885 [Ferruginibacter sp.]
MTKFFLLYETGCITYPGIVVSLTSGYSSSFIILHKSIHSHYRQ